MAKKTAKAAETEEKDTTQATVQQVKGGMPLAAWMAGKPHNLVFAFNPAYNDKENPEDDAWHFVLPLEGDVVTIKTAFRGYTPKGDLSQMAMMMIADVERTLDAVVDYPIITEPRKLKSMHLAVPQFS
jgi:hypothetical protein